jgi:hypothetical protein
VAGERFLTSPGDGSQGGRQGWQAIKNCLEQFLMSRSDGPQGGRQGWQAIKNRTEERFRLSKVSLIT